MPSGFYTWDHTAATNAGADSAIGWSEGQAPSSINDSARAMMAVQAKWRDDVAGAIVTGGTSTSYTVTTYTTFDSLAHMSNQVVAFTPHATNGATVTLNVDGLGAKPLRSAPSVELLAGTLVAGTPYTAIYNASDAAFYLQNFFVNPYSIPLGCGMDYWGSSAPSTVFALAQGQAISRTTYSTLFSLFSTTYGSGDGTTTFNIPDKVGRASVMRDAGSARISSSYFGGNPANLGAVGGGESTTLTADQIPTITSSVSVSVSGTTNTVLTWRSGSGGSWVDREIAQGGSVNSQLGAVGMPGTFSGSGTGTATSNNTSGAAHRTVQPSIVCNYIIRIL